MAKKRKAGDLILKIAGMMMAIMIMPTTLMLVIGMLPTLVVYFISYRQRARVITIGAMNLAGCMPFVYGLWLGGHDFSRSISIIMDPQAILIIYAAAAVGYVIDWAVAGVVAAMVYETGKRRQKDIEKRLEGLIDRWDEKVTGTQELDSYGFPLEGGLNSDRDSANTHKM